MAFELAAGVLVFEYICLKTNTMLTIQVNDARLEQQLIEQAQAKGKTAEQLATSILAEALNQLAPLPFSFPRLDPTQHSRPLQFDVDSETDNAPVFEHVTDTVEFANELRQNAWKR